MHWNYLAPLAVVAILAVSLACNSAPPPPSGIDAAGMDKSIKPGDDFNLFANGGWYKATPIPADKSAYGIFSILADDTRKQLLAIVQDAAKATSSADPDTAKVGAYYSTFMDEAAIEAKGAGPLKPELAGIAAIKDRRDLSRALGATLRADTDALNNTSFETPNLFGVWVTQGLTDPDHSYPYLMQGGLGMPDRDYYLSASPHMADLRKQYQQHLQAMLQLAGLDRAAERAARVYALELKIASAHMTRVESEDVHNAVTWSHADLVAKAPGLDWPAFLTAASLNDAPTFYIWHPKSIPALSKLTESEPVDAWKDWLSYHAIENAAPFLSKAFVTERFNFSGKALSGIPQIRERWQRGMDLASGALGDALGKIYARKYFPAETKKKVESMVADLIRAFAVRIDALGWMSPATKEKAKAKLTTLRVGVGYTEHWIDYSGLQITPGDALGNAQRADLFEYHRQLAKLHQAVDKSEWWMTPQTVNAVNLPLQNALNFPAAIIQPPYYDPTADAAHNYGAMGAIIGHEISHSFDDQGAMFDSEGRLRDWWTPDDLKHFQAAGAALAAQFSSYHPFPDLAINGQQTLSENIADLAGLLVAFDAYHLSLHGAVDAVKDGLTGDQRFFISFAQSWREKMRDEQMRRAIATDGHAPGPYRARTVRNLDPWYPSFSVQPGEKLYLDPPARVRIW